MVPSLDEIKNDWSNASTPAEEENVKKRLAPWLYETQEGDRVPLEGSLRRNPLSSWDSIFQSFGLNTAYYTPVMRLERKCGMEQWLETQLFPKNTTHSSLGMQLLCDVIRDTAGGGGEVKSLYKLSCDLMARTLSLIARGNSDMEVHTMMQIDAYRIYPFLELDIPTTEQIEAVWQEISNETRAFDPSGLCIQKSIAFALANSSSDIHFDSNIIRDIIKDIQVGITELLCYVGMCHNYIDSIHTNDDLLFGGGDDRPQTGDDRGMLHRNMASLTEALGPRLNQKPPNYPTFYGHKDNLVHLVLENKRNLAIRLLSHPHGLETDETRDEYGCTALIWACRRGYTQLVDLLLAAGADPNKQARKMGSPLHWASSYGHPDACLHLMRAGADIEAGDDKDETPVDVIGRFLQMNKGESNGFATDTVMRTVMLQKRRGDKMKQMGNNAFRKGRYNQALEKYREALKEYAFECPIQRGIVNSNMSQCYMNLQDYANAKERALFALRDNPENEKALHRLERANEGLSNDAQ